jgi:Tfp pilus assembly protein FimT
MTELLVTVALLVIFAALVFGIVYSEIAAHREREREERYRADFVKRHRSGL